MEPNQKNYHFYVFMRWKLDVSPKQKCEEFAQVFPNVTSNERTIYRWIEEYREGIRQTLSDKPKTGRPCSSLTAKHITDVQEIVDNNPKHIHPSNRFMLNLSKTSVDRILTEDLDMHKACSVWVQYMLPQQNKLDRVKCAKSIKKALSDAENIDDIYVVTDETWIMLDPHLTKTNNKAWLEKGQPRLQVCHPGITSHKCILLVAFTPSGRFSVQVLSYGTTVASQIFRDFHHQTDENGDVCTVIPSISMKCFFKWTMPEPYVCPGN